MTNKHELYWIEKYKNTFNNRGMYIDLRYNTQLLRHIPNKKKKTTK
jgi:hypothetical protein